MYFDRETTVVVTKLNHLSELSIKSYCENFGPVARCLIKISTNSRNKDPYALVKFNEPASVKTVLTNPNHQIEGVNVVMRPFLVEPKSTPHFDQIMQENLALKYEIVNLQKSLSEAQTYSKTAYETFQALREKYEAEQVLSNQLKTDHAAMIESYEKRLKEQPSSTDRVKDEPMDADGQPNNQLLEMQIVKDRLEQAQIDLGKCQTENAILQAKLASREQQFDARYKELSAQYARLKRQYDHVTTCVREFQTNLNPRKRVKLERRENVTENEQDTSDDVVEIVMAVDGRASTEN